MTGVPLTTPWRDGKKLSRFKGWFQTSWQSMLQKYLLDNQNQFLWRLPSNPTSPESLKSNLRLPRYEDHTTSKIIKSRNLYISRVTSIRPNIPRETESNMAAPELHQSNPTSPETNSNMAAPELHQSDPTSPERPIQTWRLPSYSNQTLHPPSDRIKHGDFSKVHVPAC